MDYTQKMNKIIYTLFEHNGLQYLVNVAEEVLNNPIFIYDISGKVLAKSQSNTANFVWKDLMPVDYLNEEFLNVTEQAGVIEQLMTQDTPVYGTFSYSPYSVLGCRVRDKNGVVGIVTIVEYHPLSEEDAELLVVLCKAVLYEMLYCERTVMQTIPYFQLFRDIIENECSKDEILERCDILHLNFPKLMQLIEIRFSGNKTNFLSLYFNRDTFLKSFSENYCIIYEGSLFLIASNQTLDSPMLRQILRLYPNDELQISISKEFKDIAELRSAFKQVKAIHSIRLKLNMKQTTIFYKDVLLYHFMQIATREYDINDFCAPVVSQMKEYDRDNNTLYLESVDAFLESGRNRQKAAERLHIHKNTLYYRLRRAEDLFHLDLNDENICFHLQFSLRMVRMIR